VVTLRQADVGIKLENNGRTVAIASCWPHRSSRSCFLGITAPPDEDFVRNVGAAGVQYRERAIEAGNLRPLHGIPADVLRTTPAEIATPALPSLGLA